VSVAEAVAPEALCALAVRFTQVVVKVENLLFTLFDLLLPLVDLRRELLQLGLLLGELGRRRLLLALLCAASRFFLAFPFAVDNVAMSQTRSLVFGVVRRSVLTVGFGNIRHGSVFVLFFFVLCRLAGFVLNGK